ncbi:MAG: undecaprenyl/decaprenyl-phosphate alpha-N-acetylglucosaminyl 1-phosphate transferase [Bacteroidales bacterium]|nr:undecaprenyl/decaprenyl-phosphate alpha-N-acetylglucosaminyl 1-phosphate transferase [Bacteroidales bacterium]
MLVDILFEKYGSPRIWLIIALCAGAALFASRWIYFKILRIAKAKNLVDNPDARKLQKQPVPVLGGIAAFFGVLAAVLLGSCCWNLGDIIPIILAMSIMLYVGAIDDTVGLSPLSRIVVESITIIGLIYGSNCCVDGLQEMWGISQFSWWIAVPFTVFAGVGIINSINMIDGVNGLSSGYCIVASILFGICFLRTADYPNALLAFSFGFALIPFIFHNIFGSKSRMFIGDAGTMMMGIMTTWFVIRTLSSNSPAQYIGFRDRQNLIAFSLAVFSVPVFDTLRVMGMRIYNGKSPFQADKTHLHHMLLALNLSAVVISFVEVLIMLIITGGWLLSFKVFHLDIHWQLYIVLFLCVLLVWGPFYLIRRHLNKNSRTVRYINSLSNHWRTRYAKQWMRIKRLMDHPAEDCNN